MSKLKRTKCDWNYYLHKRGKNTSYIVCSDGDGPPRRIATVKLRDDGEDAGNACLIAMAPTLLEFIKELATQTGQLHEDKCRMRQLIAQAQGEDYE